MVRGYPLHRFDVMENPLAIFKIHRRDHKQPWLLLNISAVEWAVLVVVAAVAVVVAFYLSNPV